MYSKYIGMSMYVFIYECACVQVSHNVCTYAYNRRYIKLDKCMYVCMYIYIYICMLVFTFTCLYVYKDVHMYMGIYLYVCVYVYICVYVDMDIHIYTCV